jgi:hypothetical protein
MTVRQLYLFGCLYLVMLIASAVFTRATLRRIAGALAGLTAVIRADTPAIAVVLAALPLLRFVSWRGRIMYAAAWFGGALPLAWHALRIGPSLLFDNLFTETVILARPGRGLPLPPTDPLLSSMFYLIIALAVLVVVATVVAFVRRRDSSRWPCLSLAIFTVFVMPQAFQRADQEHLMAGRPVADYLITARPLDPA